MTGYSVDSEGNVVLTMVREDYEWLLLLLGSAAGLKVVLPDHIALELDSIFALVNRLNAGNENFTPYRGKMPA